MPEITILGYIACTAAALAGGFIDAISGGGGLLTMPALLLSGVPPHIALGTNKVSACFGTTVALINFSLNRLVRWHMAAYGLGFSILGSWLGSLLALYLNPHLLGKILVILLPFAMLATLVPHKKGQQSEFKEEGRRFWILLPTICFLIGTYDGFFGPATGSFLILALYWLGLGMVQASATAKAFNLGSNVSAAVSFIWHGAVYWPLALLMAGCFMIGNWTGSALAIKIGAKVVRRFLVVSLVLLTISLVIRYFL